MNYEKFVFNNVSKNAFPLNLAIEMQSLHFVMIHVCMIKFNTFHLTNRRTQ